MRRTTTTKPNWARQALTTAAGALAIGLVVAPARADLRVTVDQVTVPQGEQAIVLVRLSDPMGDDNPATLWIAGMRLSLQVGDGAGILPVLAGPPDFSLAALPPAQRTLWAQVGANPFVTPVETSADPVANPPTFAAWDVEAGILPPPDDATVTHLNGFDGVLAKFVFETAGVPLGAYSVRLSGMAPDNLPGDDTNFTLLDPDTLAPSTLTPGFVAGEILVAQPNDVPEPGSALTLAAAAAGTLLSRRRRHAQGFSVPGSTNSDGT